MSDRAEILNKAAELIGGDREQDYGSAAENFARIGRLWAEIVGVPISPEQVALMMNQVKVARLVSSPDHLDSWVDGAGYLALGGEIATADIELDGGIVGAMQAWERQYFEPRVVKKLTVDCVDSQWIDSNGVRFRFNDGAWEFNYGLERNPRWVEASDPAPGPDYADYFTEVIN